MTTKTAIAKTTAWQLGTNELGDQALNRARDSLIAGDLPQCFTALRDAMEQYGWQFHSDRKARRLWSEWRQIKARLQSLNSFVNDANLRSLVVDLFHETYRAVHFDRDRKVRRNMPPDDPAARIESLVVPVPLPS